MLKLIWSSPDESQTVPNLFRAYVDLHKVNSLFFDLLGKYFFILLVDWLVSIYFVYSKTFNFARGTFCIPLPEIVVPDLKLIGVTQTSIFTP